MMTDSSLPPSEKRRSWLIVLLVFLFICGCIGLVVGPARPLIENVLGTRLFPPGDGESTETPTPPLTCGDGFCDVSAKEDCDSCSKDCGDCTPPPPSCGDGVCDVRAEEDCNNCSKDCGDCTPPPPACGDGVCDRDAGEDCKTCERDCGECPVVNPRGACLDPCDPANSSCQAGLACVPEATSSSQYICWNQDICDVSTQRPTCNNNGVCESGEGTGCPDCKPCVCGDGVCEQARCNELQQNCPADCGVGNPCAGSYCGDGVCRPECGENKTSCPSGYPVNGDC